MLGKALGVIENAFRRLVAPVVNEGDLRRMKVVLPCRLAVNPEIGLPYDATVAVVDLFKAGLSLLIEHGLPARAKMRLFDQITILIVAAGYFGVALLCVDRLAIGPKKKWFQGHGRIGLSPT